MDEKGNVQMELIAPIGTRNSDKITREKRFNRAFLSIYFRERNVSNYRSKIWKIRFNRDESTRWKISDIAEYKSRGYITEKKDVARR